jgi:hypothetical protein
MANYSVDADLAPYESDLAWGLDGQSDFTVQATEAKRILDDHMVANMEVETGDLLLLSTVTLSVLKTLSVFYVLYQIFNKHANGPGDSFDLKAQRYLDMYSAKLVGLKVRLGTDDDPDESYSSGQLQLG